MAIYRDKTPIAPRTDQVRQGPTPEFREAPKPRRLPPSERTTMRQDTVRKYTNLQRTPDTPPQPYWSPHGDIAKGSDPSDDQHRPYRNERIDPSANATPLYGENMFEQGDQSISSNNELMAWPEDIAEPDAERPGSQRPVRRSISGTY